MSMPLHAIEDLKGPIPKCRNSSFLFFESSANIFGSQLLECCFLVPYSGLRYSGTEILEQLGAMNFQELLVPEIRRP